MSVPVFVYGSLLSGLHNHPMAERALVNPPYKARTTSGYKLYSNHGASFPYLAEDAEGGVVQGEVLHMKEGRELDQIISMELGAGYDGKVIKVEVQGATDGPEDWVEIQALAFIHREDRATARGEHVTDGDWRKYHAEHGFDWSPFVRRGRG